MTKNITPKRYERQCMVDDCVMAVGRHGAKGYCSKHYKRFKAHGDPLVERVEIPKEPWRVCSVEGCSNRSRNRSSELCKMHYHRWYRTGVVGEPQRRIRSRKNDECAVEECTKPDDEAGYCSMHATRIRRHGDVSVVIPPDERNLPSGEKSHAWLGNQAGYGAAHERVKRARGSASLHACVDCSEQAYHWSYDHNCKDEQVRLVRGYYVAYSPNIDKYSPRCVPCHKRFDLDRVDAFPVSQFYPLDGAL